jgi:hypothetical protein
MKQYMAIIPAWLHRKSVSAVATLENSLSRIMWGWIAVITLAGLLRTAFAVSPINTPFQLFETLLPYVLTGLAPIAAYQIATRAFPRGSLLQQPEIRLARYGKWDDVDVLSARRHPLFGPTGMMASLLIGMLLNVPVRTLEFLAAVPAMNSNAPLWGQVILTVMTADVVIMNFLYVIAFVAALRCAPWFPRLLLVVWSADMMSQMAMANAVSAVAGLPLTVAESMSLLLQGNLQKVMISIIIWTPYLLLSSRVNLTYRMRVQAARG